ncbi:TPA: ABC transporter ATP-binding protein [Streptococcus equi subsp. zooepidemicus]|nr:ABC transporter ATP-binding protein [Streptococcus equi subsp. zooepidemicus]HEL0165660.1 ABC transporter ATP-binding protein [Streptococcus equi subsp. zooepidemicus]HEL0170081.1 ABC transporter ATP-binding protein [Streptococcus equi subsp. zooepidemicus]HEL0171753.1 ABC transporter ATP-binding protein [Streptococcus equi subsp. zooepidemicus]HEL0186158.1 ABC transporter ATP-binding protein [Streptococcus equi subsp. zooepidemicus]
MTLFIKLIKEIKAVTLAFSLAIGFLLVATAGGQMAPLLLQQTIDRYLTPIARGKEIPIEGFQRLLLLYLLLIVITAVLRYISYRMLVYSSNRIVANLRNRAFNVMQRLPIAYFDHQPAGKIATRIVNDTETLKNQFYDNLLSQIIVSASQIVFIYVVMIYLDVKSGLLLLLIMPLFYGMQWLYKSLTDQPMKDFYQARSAVNTQVNETMNGVSIIQLYHQEDTILEEFEEQIHQMKTADDRIIFAESVASWTLTELVKYGMIAAILAVIGYQFLQGRSGITVGKLFIYVNYLMRLFDLLSMLVRQLPNIQRSTATGTRLMKLLEAQTEPDKARAIELTDGTVDFTKVYFAYENGKTVLSDITIHADKGETVALVGHTGSGKSSIMNLLYRFYDVQSGLITIDGQNIQEYSRESLRSQMGIVLQDPYLFTGTIASNITMGNPAYSDQDILEALEKVGASSMVARLEKGIHEPVYEKGASYSSGERQLIAFARTLIADPKILILDEATSHIDTETEDIIQQAMEVLKKGRTTFIIAHRLSTIQSANQILVLDKGRIVERGTHQELLDKQGIYAEMSKLQEKVAVQ